MPDKIDFEFTDDAEQRFRVVSYGRNGEPWLFTQHVDGHWVSQRKCTEQDMLFFLKCRDENTGV